MRSTVAFLLALICLAPMASAQADGVFPGHADVVARLDAAREAAPEWISLQTLGASVEGRELRLAVITDPDSPMPMDERVVTLILTQQHGNEPAGTPAALDLIDAIAAGDPLRQHLANQIVLVQPMGNPDGAMAGQRANAAGADLNRDHVHLEHPETQIVHGLFNAWDIHVGVDHHEYSGTGTGSPVPIRTYDYDATIMYPRHGNVRAPTVEAAQALMDGMAEAAEAEGYSVGDYGTMTAAGIPLDHLAGGPDPGILRNNFGLNNIAGLLVESFVPLTPNPTIDGERRADVHRSIMDGTLEYVSEHAAMFIDAKRSTQRLNIEDPMDEYIQEWPDHPVTGEPNEGNIRGPLAEAYTAESSLDELMVLHGLPTAAPGTTYSTHHERQGLLGAILAPDSSRQVVPTQPATLDSAEPPAEAEPTPAVPVLLVLAAIALAGRRLNA